jgi:hypothetical protein
MTVKVENRHLLEIQTHLEKNIMWFGKKHADVKVRNQDCVIALMVLKGLTACLLAGMAKTIGLDKDVMLEKFVEEIKDSFLIFDEFEKTKEKLQ